MLLKINFFIFAPSATPAVPEVVGGTFEASLYEKQQINADAKLGAG